MLFITTVYAYAAVIILAITAAALGYRSFAMWTAWAAQLGMLFFVIGYIVLRIWQRWPHLHLHE